MSIQTELMRTGAEKEILTAKDGQGYFGVEYVNHPTPSGCERWLPTYSDKRRFKTAEIAIKEFKSLLIESVPKIRKPKKPVRRKKCT
jgi:hypothetical protein